MKEEVKASLVRGNICQFNPTVERKGLRGCFMVVTEPKNWGAVGYVMKPSTDASPSQRLEVSGQWKELELVGKAHYYSSKN